MTGHPLNVLVVHGIGDYPTVITEFGRDLTAAVRRCLGEVSDRYHLPGAPRGPLLNVIPGQWASVPEGFLKELERRLFSGRVDRLRAFAMRFMGDVIAYQGAAVYEEIHRALADALRRRLKTESGHLTVVAHSLGSIIASDFIYDHTRRCGSGFRDHFGVDFVNFFTVGSPLALYAAHAPAGGVGNGGPGLMVDRFDAPVRVESASGVWLNIYDTDDVVGYPLTSLNEAYATAVTADVVIEAGNLLTRWNLLSHNAYWTEDAVVTMLGEKLAIDYAACNLGLQGAQCQDALAQYRRRVVSGASPKADSSVGRTRPVSSTHPV
ncbi:MAG: hypothetical protein ACOYXR_13410 [Nitrospirota bacterium]